MAKTVQVSSGTWRQWMGEGTRCHDTVYLPSRSRLRVCSFHSNTETKPHSPLRLRQNSANVYWFLPRPIFMHNLILIETGLSWVYRHYRIQTKLITTCSYRVFTKLVALITTYLGVRLVEFLLISTCMVWYLVKFTLFCCSCQRGSRIWLYYCAIRCGRRAYTTAELDVEGLSWTQSKIS